MANEQSWAFFEKWAKDQGVTYSTWLNWRKRGVPHWARLAILDAARAKRISIDRAAFDEQPARENGRAMRVAS